MTSLLRVSKLSWLFTQNSPLDTRSFPAEAKRRGFDVDLPLLRELYRRGLLIPFAAIRKKPVSESMASVTPEPRRVGGTRLEQFRRARESGCLQDLTTIPFSRGPRFAPSSNQATSGWWNGLLYSRYQLLVLPHLREILAHCRLVNRAGGQVVRLPDPSQGLVELAQRFHVIALVVTALEARYLPNLDPEWVRLSNADYEEWASYRDKFDPAEVSATLAYPADQARADAEHLLSLAHTVDPLGREWGPLVRRAPRRAWDGLKDNARLTMDLREAAEILLRFHEDLAAQGQAEPLPQLSRRSWHPLHERLSVRVRTLDEDLSRLGVSPHPRVVLAIEGDSEAVHVPKVWSVLGFRDAPELMRVLVLGSVDRDLEKVAALAAAPLINRRQHADTTFEFLRPPTKLMVAVDPEGKYFAPGKVDRTRDQIVKEIRAVVEAQGANVAEDDLRELVEIRTWNGPCYELAHFNNDELAEGILKINTTSQLTHEQLSASVAQTRRRKKDIKEVWSQWPRKVSKVDLAHALWPTLESKIAEAIANETVPLPEIAEVLAAVYQTAQHWQFGSFLLSADVTEGFE